MSSFKLPNVQRETFSCHDDLTWTTPWRQDKLLLLLMLWHTNAAVFSVTFGHSIPENSGLEMTLIVG
jgi:hypothetical protein